MKTSAIDMHSHINTGTPYDNVEHEGYRADLDWFNQVRIASYT